MRLILIAILTCSISYASTNETNNIVANMPSGGIGIDISKLIYSPFTFMGMGQSQTYEMINTTNVAMNGYSNVVVYTEATDHLSYEERIELRKKAIVIMGALVMFGYIAKKEMMRKRENTTEEIETTNTGE